MKIIEVKREVISVADLAQDIMDEISNERDFSRLIVRFQHEETYKWYTKGIVRDVDIRKSPRVFLLRDFLRCHGLKAVGVSYHPCDLVYDF